MLALEQVEDAAKLQAATEQAAQEQVCQQTMGSVTEVAQRCMVALGHPVTKQLAVHHSAEQVLGLVA